MPSSLPTLDLSRRDRAAFVGMVHLLPLPGSSRWGGDLAAVRAAARRDAEILLDGGCDALLVENMGDVPYLKGGVPPETVAAFAVAAEEVASLGAPLGVQVLAAANREALGVAVAVGASFVRVEGFAYAHVADEGWIDASAGPLARARAALGADVRFWADAKKKHAAHAVTGDLDVAAVARGAAFCGADAVVVTGGETGAPTALADVRAAAAAGLPVVVGSGVTAANAGAFATECAAVVVGTALKEGADWRAPVALDRVRAVRAALDGGAA